METLVLNLNGCNKFVVSGLESQLVELKVEEAALRPNTESHKRSHLLPTKCELEESAGERSGCQ